MCTETPAPCTFLLWIAHRLHTGVGASSTRLRDTVEGSACARVRARATERGRAPRAQPFANAVSVRQTARRDARGLHGLRRRQHVCVPPSHRVLGNCGVDWLVSSTCANHEIKVRCVTLPPRSYDIMSNGQQVFTALEESGCCERQFCKNMRPFKMSVCFAHFFARRNLP